MWSFCKAAFRSDGPFTPAFPAEPSRYKQTQTAWWHFCFNFLPKSLQTQEWRKKSRRHERQTTGSLILSEGNLNWSSSSHPVYEALELCTLHGPRCFDICKLLDDKLGCPVLLPKFREQIRQCCPEVWQQGTAHLREEHTLVNEHRATGTQPD